jgi:alkylated DNA repair protein alkB family protein 8
LATQVTVNEYLVGQGIRRHTDTHSAFEDGICSLSLGAAVVMEFQHPDGTRKVQCQSIFENIQASV